MNSNSNNLSPHEIKMTGTIEADDLEFDLPGRATLNKQTLNEIRAGRRLEKIVSSIESFLNSQVARIDAALEQCNQAVENDKVLQRILADFELEKQEWEVGRQQEIHRLQAAGEDLIRGWEQLESERRKFLDECHG